MPVWQNEQVSVQPTWLDTHSVPRLGLRDVDALDLVRPLARVLAGQPQQPFARAVDRDLLGDDFGPPSVKCSSSAARSSFDTLVIASKRVTPRT